MRLVALFVLVAGGLAPTFGCDSGPNGLDPGDLAQDPARLVGTWDWVESTVYETASGQPETYTPQTTGRSEVYTFNADGTYTRQYAPDPPFGGRYTVRESTVYGETDEFLGAYGVNTQYLRLDTSDADGPVALYRRRAE